jgi:hypothetical protein
MSLRRFVEDSSKTREEDVAGMQLSDISLATDNLIYPVCKQWYRYLRHHTEAPFGILTSYGGLPDYRLLQHPVVSRGTHGTSDLYNSTFLCRHFYIRYSPENLRSIT